MSVSVKFAWYDLWVGAFVERHHPDYRLVVYVCPLPTLLFVLRFGETLDNISPRYRPMTTGGLPDEAFWPDDASDGLSNDELAVLKEEAQRAQTERDEAREREAKLREALQTIVAANPRESLSLRGAESWKIARAALSDGEGET